jgi:hypothetical protein
MAIGAAATAGSAWILKPLLNHMVMMSGFADLRRVSWAVAGLFLLRGLAKAANGLCWSPSCRHCRGLETRLVAPGTGRLAIFVGKSCCGTLPFRRKSN